MKKKLLSALMAGMLMTGIGATSVTTYANPINYNEQTNHVLLTDEAYKPGKIIVTIGANNSPQQRDELLKEFGISKGDENATIISVTNQDIAKEEGYKGDISKIANENSFSSCKITLLPEKSGIQVKTHNLTQVTGNMLASAISTCGITDASIDADAPFPVTGQAALAGVLMAFQKATGEQIPEQNKQVANNEINTTTSLANSVGQEKAESVVNQAKEQIVKEQPKDQQQVDKIVNKAASDNGVALTPEQQKQLTKLMDEINSLKLNQDQVQSTLNKIQESINSGKKDFSEVSEKLQKEIENNSVALGKIESMLRSIKNFFVNIWNDITSDSNKTEQQPTENQQPAQEGNQQQQQQQQNNQQQNNQQQNNQQQNNQQGNIAVGTQGTN